MIATIQGGYAAIKGALDIAQGFQALKTETAVNSAVVTIQRNLIEGQRALNDAEARHSADLARIAELEREIIRLNDWSAEKENYQLVSIARVAFAYMPKPGMERGQPAHWLCANCFDQGRKSFMQFKGAMSESLFGCDSCNASFRIPNRITPAYSQRSLADQ